MQIRDAEVADADRIAALNAAGWREGFRGVVDEVYLAAYDGLPGLRRDTLTSPGPHDVQLVAVDDGDLVGWVAGAPVDRSGPGDTVFEVRACYVAPDRWRAGIGRELMTALLARLDPHRWTDVVLWTAKGAMTSNRFYASLGMIRDGAEATIDRNGPLVLIRYSASAEALRRSLRRQTPESGPRPSVRPSPTPGLPGNASSGTPPPDQESTR